MNTTQIQSTLAPLVAFLAGILATKVPFLSANLWTELIMYVIGIGGVIWGGLSTTKTQLISTVAQQPEVKQVVLEQSAPASLVQATPNNVTK